MIVGEAELDIRAVGAQFQSDITRSVKPGMASAGKEAERTASGMRHAFAGVWTAFGAQSQGALGPVSMVIGQIQAAAESIGKNASLAQKGMVAGAVGAGFGVGLQALGSGELAAQQQLQLSVENLGKSYDDYNGQVEKTIKTGEKHGHTAEDTLRVLNQLTIATKDPAKALANYNVILDMAAVRHVPLQTAARMLSMTYAGNSRALKTFGIDLTAGTKALAEAKTATDAHATATDTLKKARQNLLDVEARIGAARKGHASGAAQLASAEARAQSASASVAETEFKHGQLSPQAAAARSRLAAAEANLTKVRGEGVGTTKLTVSQQIDLRKAHEAVIEAEKNVKKSATDMASAHQAAAGAVTNADQAVKLLADRVRGQADPAMNTFSGHLHAYWATAEDDLASFGNKWGGTVTGISTGVLATSALLAGAQSMWAKYAKSGGDAASAVESDMAGMETSSRGSLARMGGAVAGVALAIGTLEVGKATAGSGTGGAVATSLMGAVSGAAIGLSVGGPFGAAVGGAVGLLGGLADHFYAAGGAARAAAKDVDKFTTDLEASYQADSYKLGQQSRQAITQFLSSPSQAGNAELLSSAGVTMDQIIAGIRQPGSRGSAQAQVSNAYTSGKISGGEMSQSLDLLQTIANQFSSKVTQADAVAAINGVVGQNTKDTRQALSSLLTPPRGGARSAIPNTTEQAMLVALLAIQHNTAKGATNTQDLHTTVQRNGRIQFGRSPELATL